MSSWVRFPKSDLTNVYAVLIQAQLSLDRALTVSWGELQSYYHGYRLKTLEDCAALFRSHFDRSELGPLAGDKVRLLPVWFRGLFYRFASKAPLHRSEIALISSSIEGTLIYLRAPEKPPNETTINLRMSLCSGSLTLECLLRRTPRLKMARAVEHFGDPPFIDHVPLEEIISGN